MSGNFRWIALVGEVAMVGAMTVLGLADEKASKPARGTTSNTGVASGFCRVHELDGMRVKSPDGEELGKIEDLVIELDDGRVSYAALSFGGLFGFGNKLFAIPWNALEIKTSDAKEKHFVLAIDKEQLKKAPGFEKSHWPDLANPTWSHDVDEFYKAHVKTAKPPARDTTKRE